MSVSVRASSSKDIKYIFDNLSDVSRAELAAAEMDVSAAMQECFRALNSAITGVIDGQPAFIFWLSTHPLGGDRVTSFLASSVYFRKVVSATKLTRSILRQLARSGAMFAMTESPHPNAAKWFETIGFRHVETIDTLKVFEYPASGC